MRRAPIDARGHLLTLVDRPIPTFRGRMLTVLEVRDRAVVVRTPRSPGGTAVPITGVQRGIDRLLRDGEAPPTAAALGRRSEFVGAVLLTVPGTVRSSDPARIVLRRRRRSMLRPLISTCLGELRQLLVGIRQPTRRRGSPSVLTAGGAWPLVLLGSCAAVAITTYGWTSSPARPLVTTWFLLACPGMALVRFLPYRGVFTLLVLALATSLSLETIIAEAMLKASAWSPHGTLAILIAVTLAGSGIQLRAGLERRSHVPGSRSRTVESRGA
jgi:hypothetical protein